MRQYLYSLITDKQKGLLSSILKIILAILAIIYRLVIGFILFLYKLKILKVYKSSCKVVSVGNITWGGTGKTPLVEKIAIYLKDKGRKVTILSRGYKLDSELADEPQYLKENLKDITVLVGKNRIKNLKLAQDDYSADTIILDDGFQYWCLTRDLNIVCIDATNPFGNDWVIPRGILREPLISLRRADIFFLTKTDLGKDSLTAIKDKLKKINPKALMVESIYSALDLSNLKNKETKIKTDELKGKGVCLLASIANPGYFEYMISSLRADVVLKFYYPDHYPYKKEDVDKVMNSCFKEGIEAIITTQKDAVRLSGFAQRAAIKPSILILNIEVKITQNENEFLNRLSSVCNC